MSEPSTELILATPAALQLAEIDPEVIEKALMTNDLSKLSPEHRLQYYRAMCISVGLNPLTQPFTLLKRQDGTYWLYANSSCAEQLRKAHRVSTKILARVHETILDEPLYRVEAEASAPDGRTYQAQAVTSLMKPRKEPTGQKWPDGNPKMRDVLDSEGNAVMQPLRGLELANAIMRTDTKACRRATLGLVGLGWMEMAEPGDRPMVNMQTGEILEPEVVDASRPGDTAVMTDAKAQETIGELFGAGH